MKIGERKAMPFAKFAEIARIMQAFSLRDLQTCVTIAGWMGQNGITFADMVAYLYMEPAMREATSILYFAPYCLSAAMNKRIREFEKKLPKDIRKELRAARFEATRYGKIPPKSG